MRSANETRQLVALVVDYSRATHPVRRLDLASAPVEEPLAHLGVGSVAADDEIGHGSSPVFKQNCRRAAICKFYVFELLSPTNIETTSAKLSKPGTRESTHCDGIYLNGNGAFDAVVERESLLICLVGVRWICVGLI